MPFDIAELQSNLLGDSSFVYHEGIKCDDSKDDIVGPRYFTKCVVSTGTEKRYNYSEEAFFKT